MPSQSPASGRPRAGLDAIYVPGTLRLPTVSDGLAEWRQGDLLRGVGLFWAGTEDDDELTGLAVPPSAGQQWPVVAWDGQPAAEENPAPPSVEPTGGLELVPEWSIITSQTCDIAAAGPGARHPVVQVSPLVNLDGVDPSKVTAIRRHANVDLTPVPKVPGGGTWAADLRISLPVSKAVLLRQDRSHGFYDSAEALAFAERVAAKYRRPALHDELTGEFITGLSKAVTQGKKAGQPWTDSIEQLRLLVTAGDKLSPKSVAVLAIMLEPLSLEERRPLQAWRNVERKRLLKASDITLDPIRFRTLDTVSVRDYRASDWLRITELGQPAFW